MAQVVLNPYLQFNGNAKEALDFYKKVFGGEAAISLFSDMPDMPVKDDQKGMIMHAVLKADGLQLMLSDATPSGGVEMGGNVSISLSGDDEAKLKTYFAGLSDGGEVTVPLAVHPWGDTFGMLNDKFGIHWLINISADKK